LIASTDTRADFAQNNYLKISQFLFFLATTPAVPHHKNYIMRRNLELFQLAFSTDLSEIMNLDVTKTFVLHL